MYRNPWSEDGSQFDPDQVWQQQEQRRRRSGLRDERIVPRPGCLVELCGEVIPLELVEFRILNFLSRKPYKAYTRRQIVQAISTPQHPVTEQTLDQHVDSLRAKLGLFSDYVQSVPYVGYRFKE